MTMSGKRKKIEDSQRQQLVLYFRQKLKPQYPDLNLLVIRNNGYFDIITEKSHPDLLWRLRHNEEYYFLYHELKKSDGKLDADQEKWWAEFKPTKTVHGIITKGWESHLDGVHNWLTSLNALPIVQR